MLLKKPFPTSLPTKVVPPTVSLLSVTLLCFLALIALNSDRGLLVRILQIMYNRLTLVLTFWEAGYISLRYPFCQAHPQLQPQLQIWLRLVLFFNSSSHPIKSNRESILTPSRLY